MPWAPYLITVVPYTPAARNTRPRRKGCDRCRYCYQTRRLSRRSPDLKRRFCKHLLISASMAARPAAVRPSDYSWSLCAISAGFRTLPRSSFDARRRRSLIPAGYGMRAKTYIHESVELHTWEPVSGAGDAAARLSFRTCSLTPRSMTGRVPRSH